MSYPSKLKKEAIRLHKEEGRSAEWIAEKFSKEQPPEDRPAARTIRNWLNNHKRFQQEEAVRSMIERQTEPIFAKAREEHLNSIRNSIREWINNLNEVPTAQAFVSGHPLIDDWFAIRFDEGFPEYDPNFEEDMKEHLPFPDLWRKHLEWWNMHYEYSQNIQKVVRIIYKEGVSRHTKLGEHFAYPALNIIDSEYGKYLSEDTYIYLKPKFECDGEKLVAKYEKETWHILESNKPQHYRARYDSMVDYVLETDEVNQLFSSRYEIDKLMREMRSYLTDILERRDYIWYSCPRCPSPPDA